MYYQDFHKMATLCPNECLIFFIHHNKNLDKPYGLILIDMKFILMTLLRRTCHQY